MKIYTKGGDKGKTSIIGGRRLPKHHIRLEAYGTIDELISWIGLINDSGAEDKNSNLLKEIQEDLMDLAAIVATDPDGVIRPDLFPDESRISMLEKRIDEMDELLPQLTSFVLPGGNIVSSNCQVARTVCRRAERRVSDLFDIEPGPDIVIRYLNRLSDYLFTLARYVLYKSDIQDVMWIKKS